MNLRIVVTERSQPSAAGVTAAQAERMKTQRSWDEAIEAWGLWCRAGGRPETTASLRTYHLRRVAAAMPSGPTTVTVDDLTEWLGAQDWAPETRRSYRGSLRGFFAWMQATGRRVDSPAHLLPPVRVPRGRPRPTPEDVYRRAVAVAPARDRLAIRLAAQCGLRRGEIARVRRDDVTEDLTGWSLRVVGKGDHVRMVPMPDDLARELRRLPAGWVFPSPARPGMHLTPHHLGKIISRWLGEHWTTHTLRHRCATTAYVTTRNIRAVQELLGHAKIETTVLYTLISPDDVREAMMAAAA